MKTINITLYIAVLALCTVPILSVLTDTYIAAVYEHDVMYPSNRTNVVSRQEALRNTMKNLDVYAKQTHQASKQNASIIVFPEYGTYGLGWTRTTIIPYLEYIPDPQTKPWNPCDQHTDYQDVEVQSYLNCMARNSSMFVVANIGARQPCSVFDRNCPADGAYQFSTNVVYNQKGDFVARYFKYNLGEGEESYFNKPIVVNLTTFETPFGRFGTFTSSDILYKEPTISLINDMNITNIAYPTAWQEELPLMSAIEFHSAFAEGMSVDLLAANLHIPSLRYYGSGLYWPYYTSIDGSYVYQDSPKSAGSLVVANVTRFILPPSHESNDIQADSQGRLQWQPGATMPIRKEEWPSRTHKLTINGDGYTSLVFKRTTGVYNPRVCQGHLCCDAGIEALFPGDELFAFGAFDGYHSDGLHGDGYYLQSCIFVKCANSTIESCGSPTKSSSTDLGKMSFSGNFTSGVVFPEVLSTYDGELGIVTRIWLYQGAIIIDAGISGAPITVAMLNRDYSRDRQANKKLP